MPIEPVRWQEMSLRRLELCGVSIGPRDAGCSKEWSEISVLSALFGGDSIGSPGTPRVSPAPAGSFGRTQPFHVSAKESLISRLTLESASRQIFLRMNARSPSPPINVRMTPIWHDYPKMTESLVRRQYRGRILVMRTFASKKSSHQTKSPSVLREK
jgi:hypothetical protein